MISLYNKAHASFPLLLYLKKRGKELKLKTHLELDKKNGINTAGSLGHGLPIQQEWLLLRKLKKKVKFMF